VCFVIELNHFRVYVHCVLFHFKRKKRKKEEKTPVTSRRAASFVAFQLISSRLHIFVACVFSSRQEADHPQLCT
jgi:hypothetical protein